LAVASDRNSLEGLRRKSQVVKEYFSAMVADCQDGDGNDRLLMSDSASIRFGFIHGGGSGWRWMGVSIPGIL